MQYSKIMFLVIGILFCCTVCVLGVTSTAFSQNDGVILVTHKSTSPAWNNQVLRLPGDIQALDSQITQPIEVAFLDFKDTSVVNTLEWAIERMVNHHNRREILLVPIFSSSYVMYKHISDIANGIVAANWQQSDPDRPTIVISPAMDEEAPPTGGDPYAVTMLRECAMKVSGNNHAQKSLLLVSFGSFDDADNSCVLGQLGRIGNRISGFREVAGVTLRPHEFPPDPTIDKNAQAVEELNKTAENLLSHGALKVIVVPYVFQGDFHKVLKDYLKGKKLKGKKKICNEEKIFHDETKAWIVDVIRRGMNNQPTPPPPC
jgi:hypothetical protein